MMNLAQTIFPSSTQITISLPQRRINDEETTAADSTIDMKNSSDSDREPVSLEGYLLYRMGKSSGQSTLLWRKRFVYFSFAEGGSITVYKESPKFNVNKLNTNDGNHSSVLNSVYRKISSFGTTEATWTGMENVDFDITPELPWIAKDVEGDPASFVVEISTFNDCEVSIMEESESSSSGKPGYSVDDVDLPDEQDLDMDISGDANDDEYFAGGETLGVSSADFGDADFDFDSNEKPNYSSERTEILRGKNKYNLQREIENARKKGKPLRIYFRCEKGGNEKALWLRAFSTFGRFSSEVRIQKRLISSLSGPLHLGSSRVRIRSMENAVLARDTRNLDLSENPEDATDVDISSVEQLVLGNNPSLAKNREFRVLPNYAYPHRWMTLTEMRQEMVLNSEHFHDLRIPGCTGKEIGELKVEVLQCIGLPKLDRTSDTDAVVYLVCGSYSFVTDVIPNRQNPMWLRKARRACKFPLFHGYASLYVGVFDYAPKKSKDDFAGRIEINLSKLRPGSVYDITLPLRLSAHVYSRRKRGAIRLRFSLKWKSERDALLSYIPRKLNIPLPQNSTPNYDVTVRCSDPKAFRNIAITVHGAHLPGRFTFVQMRAAIREINYTRKYLFTALRQHVRELRHWECPSLSLYVFLSWMHCIYVNQFSLVPAYVMLYFLIMLMCNYVRYNTDEPSQYGFIPPSWEEMLMALAFGKDPGYRAIEPLELLSRKTTFKRRKSSNSLLESKVGYKVTTHVPKGKGLLKFLGLIPSKPRNAEEEHLEFPFSNGIDYPKFSVKESLIHRKSHADDLITSFDDQDNGESGRERSLSHDSQLNPLSRFSLDMELPDIMRRDSSGTKEFDEEEMNFNTAKAVLAKGTSLVSRLAMFRTVVLLFYLHLSFREKVNRPN
jgi:C2 domain